MTSEILSNNQNNQEKSNGFLNKSLLWDNIKRHRVLIIITGIVMFFASPFIEILYHMNRNNLLYDNFTFYEHADNNILPLVFGLMIFVSITFGLFLAISVMRYMHDRKALVFFSSIPVKKKVLFATQCLSGLIYFTAPLIAIYVMSVLIMPSYITFIAFSKIFLISWFIFLLVYSFIVMCANIAGTALSTVLSGGYLSVIAVVCFGCFTAFTETFYRFTNISYSGIPDGFLLPVIYFILDIVHNYDFINSIMINMLFMLLISAAFLCIGGLLNRINKTENAEKSFYFRISQAIFKYSILAIMVILSGIGFYQALQRNIIYMIIGIAVGGFISFLLINFIIYRNIREVFTGLKRFGIFVVAASVILTVFSFDIFGIDRYIPKTSNIESIELTGNSNQFSYNKYNYTDDYNYSFSDDSNIEKITDPEIIELINNVLKASMKSDSSYNYYTNDYPFSTFMNGRQIKYNVKNGFAVNKQIPYSFYFENQADTDEYINSERSLWENEKFKAFMFYPATDKKYMDDIINFSGTTFEIYISSYRDEYDSRSLNIGKAEAAELITSLNDDIFSDTFQTTNTILYRIEFTISVYNRSQNEKNESHHFYIYLNDSYKNTVAFIEKIIADGNYVQ